jgi:hypothetical protein
VKHVLHHTATPLAVSMQHGCFFGLRSEDLRSPRPDLQLRLPTIPLWAAIIVNGMSLPSITNPWKLPSSIKSSGPHGMDTWNDVADPGASPEMTDFLL